MSGFHHAPVLPNQVIAAFEGVREDGLFVDATLGGGGHSRMILEKFPRARLYGIDRDEDALRAASANLAEFGDRFRAIRGNFHDISGLVNEKIDGILMDLGVSSYQLDTAERGFSYWEKVPLDMRMDRGQDLSAFTVVNDYDATELSRILRDYGEERFAFRIAKAILAARPIEDTLTLSEIITNAIPAATRRTGGHPARRSFQALRIEVNGELEGLQSALEDGVDMLNTGGRIAVISFHSLEDRIVKQAFVGMANPCTCPPKIPVCVCGKRPKINLINRKPILAGEDELNENPRSRSAKLRIAERI